MTLSEFQEQIEQMQVSRRFALHHDAGRVFFVDPLSEEGESDVEVLNAVEALCFHLARRRFTITMLAEPAGALRLEPDAFDTLSDYYLGYAGSLPQSCERDERLLAFTRWINQLT